MGHVNPKHTQSLYGGSTYTIVVARGNQTYSSADHATVCKSILYWASTSVFIFHISKRMLCLEVAVLCVQ